jgi:hypothetical protein
MSDRTDVTVDFVARGEEADQYRMILVEEGPWHGDTEANLRRVQDRLFGCVEAALEGLLAEKVPESIGKTVIVELDGYDLPERDIVEFFDAFSSGIFELEDYKGALTSSRYVSDVQFKLNLNPNPALTRIAR